MLQIESRESSKSSRILNRSSQEEWLKKVELNWMMIGREKQIRNNSHRRSNNQSTPGCIRNFLDSLKKDEMPTPKKSNKLDSKLIAYIIDKEKFY